jgi:hypothetical protein
MLRESEPELEGLHCAHQSQVRAPRRSSRTSLSIGQFMDSSPLARRRSTTAPSSLGHMSKGEVGLRSYSVRREGKRKIDGHRYDGSPAAAMAALEPASDIPSVPADGAPVKMSLAWEPAHEGERREYPTMAARQARDIVGAQYFAPRRKRFVHPF